jgi:hypothetical protein
VLLPLLPLLLLACLLPLLPLLACLLPLPLLLLTPAAAAAAAAAAGLRVAQLGREALARGAARGSTRFWRGRCQVPGDPGRGSARSRSFYRRLSLPCARNGACARDLDRAAELRLNCTI